MLYLLTIHTFGVVSLILGIFFAQAACDSTNLDLGKTLVFSFFAIIYLIIAITLLFCAYCEYKQLKRKR